MSRRVALWVHPDVDESSVARAILSSDYFAEFMSGEDPAEASVLTHMIVPQGHAPTLDDAVRALEANAAYMLWADEACVREKCVCLVFLDAKRTITEKVRVPFPLVVEAVQRLQAGRPLEPYMYA